MRVHRETPLPTLSQPLPPCYAVKEAAAKVIKSLWVDALINTNNIFKITLECARLPLAASGNLVVLLSLRVQLQMVSASKDYVAAKTNLLQMLICTAPLARPLFKAVKIWAKRAGLSTPTSICSACIRYFSWCSSTSSSKSRTAWRGAALTVSLLNRRSH